MPPEETPSPAEAPSGVSVCIPTHNRKDDLARTLAQLSRLVPPPDEIVVLCDGCTDDSETFLRTEYPNVRRLVNATARHCVVGRNQLMEAATHEIVIGLDDDSYPLELDFIERVRALFATIPRLAICSFAQRTNEFPETLEAKSFGPPLYTGTYVNCASALRRSTFLALGGYAGFFYQAYDEPDYALRCLADGWVIYHETALTVRHHFTPVLRNEMRTHQRHARNEFWSVLLRAPWWLAVPVAKYRALRQLGYAYRRGWSWVWNEPRWWLAALAGLGRCLALRRPVGWRAYLGWMRLVRRPVATREEVDRVMGR